MSTVASGTKVVQPLVTGLSPEQVAAFLMRLSQPAQNTSAQVPSQWVWLANTSTERNWLRETLRISKQITQTLPKTQMLEGKASKHSPVYPTVQVVTLAQFCKQQVEHWLFQNDARLTHISQQLNAVTPRAFLTYQQTQWITANLLEQALEKSLDSPAGTEENLSVSYWHWCHTPPFIRALAECLPAQALNAESSDIQALWQSVMSRYLVLQPALEALSDSSFASETPEALPHQECPVWFPGFVKLFSHKTKTQGLWTPEDSLVAVMLSLKAEKSIETVLGAGASKLIAPLAEEGSASLKGRSPTGELFLNKLDALGGLIYPPQASTALSQASCNPAPAVTAESPDKVIARLFQTTDMQPSPTLEFGYFQSPEDEIARLLNRWGARSQGYTPEATPLQASQFWVLLTPDSDLQPWLEHCQKQGLSCFPAPPPVGLKWIQENLRAGLRLVYAIVEYITEFKTQGALPEPSALSRQLRQLLTPESLLYQFTPQLTHWYATWPPTGEGTIQPATPQDTLSAVGEEGQALALNQLCDVLKTLLTRPENPKAQHQTWYQLCWTLLESAGWFQPETQRTLQAIEETSPQPGRQTMPALGYFLTQLGDWESAQRLPELTPLGDTEPEPLPVYLLTQRKAQLSWLLEHWGTLWPSLWQNSLSPENRSSFLNAAVVFVPLAQGVKTLSLLTPAQYPRQVWLPAMVDSAASHGWNAAAPEQLVQFLAQWLPHANPTQPATLGVSAYRNRWINASLQRVWPAPFLRSFLSQLRQAGRQHAATAPQESVPVADAFQATMLCACETIPDEKLQSPEQQAAVCGACSLSFCAWKPVASESTVQANALGEVSASIEATSLSPFQNQWKALIPQQGDAAPLFTPQEVLKLSPTGVNQFVECPRKFYYGKLLHLPRVQSPQAVLGILVHEIFEHFNQSFMADPQANPYTAERLQALAEALLSDGFGEVVLEDAEEALRLSSGVRQQLLQLTAVERVDLRVRIRLAFEDLAKKGYFARSIAQVLPEYPFQEVEIPGLSGVVWSGQVDALIQYADSGEWEIVDYKFYGNSQFNQKGVDSREKKLMQVLEPVEVVAGTHGEKFQTERLTRLYQLPLYYLAYGAAGGNEVSGLSLQIVRPPIAKVPEVGSERVRFDMGVFGEKMSEFVAHVQADVVRAIREAEGLAVNPGRARCERCDYAGICDGAAAVGEDDEGE